MLDLSLFYKMAHRVRHASILKNQEWLWNLLRPFFRTILGLEKNGIKLTLSSGCEIRIPAECLSWMEWTHYELRAVKAMTDWIRQHPRAVIVDAGCSFGYFSLLALATSPEVKVIAIDADISSLIAAEKICQYHDGARRLLLVHGLLSNQHQHACTLQTAVADTTHKINQLRATFDRSKMAYVCLHDQPGNDIPLHTLDQLLETQATPGQDLLIKCDVEGAELIVLQGAVQLLDKNPALLLSVHPTLLQDYFKQSREDVHAFLLAQGFKVEFLDVEHEEHWFAEKS
ncbi:MAG: FkbM family methyltransferase [Magnetococcales bacterium]|nr:FkbM family methyltransferase [Magnetococcales bacterium]